MDEEILKLPNIDLIFKLINTKFIIQGQTYVFVCLAKVNRWLYLVPFISDITEFDLSSRSLISH